MNNQPPPKQKKKLSTILIAIITIVAIVGLYLIYTVGVPFLIGDGVSNYNGVKRTVAEEAIAAERSAIDNKLRWAYFMHVEEVRPTSQEEKEQFCQAQQVDQKMPTSDDLTNTLNYTAKINVRELLGLKTRTVIYDGCQLFTKRFGSGARQDTLIDYGHF